MLATIAAAGSRIALCSNILNAVKRIAVLDIAPTAIMYASADRAFAAGYYHWFFFIQAEPLPETLIAADPNFHLRSKLTDWGKSGMEVYSEEVLAEYCGSRLPFTTFEDYRAAATIDLVHDEADRDTRIQAQLLVSGARKGLSGSSTM